MRPATQRYLQRVGLGLCVVALALGVAAGAWKPDFIDRFDAFIYDARLRATMPGTLDERIVIVDIDEASLAEYGRWPWSRHHLARLVDILFDEQDIAVLGFDVVFAEADNSSGLLQLQALATGTLQDNTDFLEALPSLAQELDYDRRFANALRDRPVVMGYYLTSDRLGHRTGQLPAPVLDPDATGERPFNATTWNGYGSNIPMLAEAASQAGFFNPIVDSDGIVRSLPLLARHEGKYYESLALAMFRVLTGMPEVRPGFPEGVSFLDQHPYISHIALEQEGRSMHIPVDHRAAVLVPYRGPGGVDGNTFTYISAEDVLAQRLPPGMLAGALVLLGTTAPGLLDLRATPISEVYPGVEVHANLLAGLLDGRIPVKPDYAAGFDVVMVIGSGLLLALALPALGVWSSVALTLATLSGLVAFNTWLYAAQDLALPLATSLLAVFAIFGLNLIYSYFIESRSKRELAHLFGSYVPPELVEEMVREPERYSMQATDRELTVMFSDMRGFTNLSETMAPADLQHFLNRLFTRLSMIIRHERGTIDKFMGDCVMAFWGAPVQEPQHARLAVLAALQMRQAVLDINAENRQQQLPDIGMGVGLNTGMMCVGDMGSELRRSYTVIGDAVNLGSRLEGLSKYYGVDVVASASTREQAGDDFVWQELDKVKVKGREEAVTIYTMWGLASEHTPEQLEPLECWNRFLHSYRSQDWNAAREHLRAYAAIGKNPKLCELYEAHIQAWEAHPPPVDWDGSARFDTK